MPAILNAVVGSPAANSFLTRDEATAILANQLYSDAWADADGEDQDKALITATKLIIDTVGNTWLGWPMSQAQALPFPRAGVYGRLGNVILSNAAVPVELKEATAEYARQLLFVLKRLPDTPSSNVGLQSFSGAGVSLTFDTSYTQETTKIPVSVWARIRWLTSRVGPSVPVIRV